MAQGWIGVLNRFSDKGAAADADSDSSVVKRPKKNPLNGDI
tara:strand:- start:257 stop:379 length:123 start_codon:yes stop_codon:yes gene_type:complete